jgi:hypothetical protein
VRRPPLFAGCRLSNLRKRLFLREGVNLLLGKMATTRRSDYLTGRDTARAARQHLQRVSTSHEYGMVISAPHPPERDDRVATTCWIGKGTHVLCRRRGHAVRRCGLVAFPRAPPHPLRRGSLFFRAEGNRRPQRQAEIVRSGSVCCAEAFSRHPSEDRCQPGRRRLAATQPRPRPSARREMSDFNDAMTSSSCFFAVTVPRYRVQEG